MSNLRTALIFSIVVGVIIAIIVGGFGLPQVAVIILAILGGVISLIIFLRIARSGN